ncbi:hypothetical protein GCM10017690_09910 [Microbacterium terregens]
MFCRGAITIHAQNPTVEASVARITWPSPARRSGVTGRAAVVVTGRSNRWSKGTHGVLSRDRAIGGFIRRAPPRINTVNPAYHGGERRSILKANREVEEL